MVPLLFFYFMCVETWSSRQWCTEEPGLNSHASHKAHPFLTTLAYQLEGIRMFWDKSHLLTEAFVFKS